MSAIIAGVVQLAGIAGVRLSPFWAGAALAGIIAMMVGISATAAGVHLYNAGYAAADGAWHEKALEAQLAAARRDQAVARAAAGDEALRAASIKQQAEQERAGTDAYVEDLERRNAALLASGKPNACSLGCDDLRGMRIKSGACAVPAGAGTADVPGKAGGKRRWPFHRSQ